MNKAIKQTEICDLEFYNSLPRICSYCQEEYTEENFKTFDHIKPMKAKNNKNGVKNKEERRYKSKRLRFDEIDNLLECCNWCNNYKGALSLDRFIDKIFKDNLISKEKKYRIAKSIAILKTNITQDI